MLFKNLKSRPREKADQGIYTSLEELLLVGGQAKGFSFLPSRNIHSILAGTHASKLRGRGMDLEELKNYVQGDNPRDIDWKTTQRTGKAHVRVYNEEKDRAVWLVVSQRASMFFGSRKLFKSVAAAHAAALALFRALSQGDRVGAVVYDDSGLRVFRPTKLEHKAVLILDEVASRNRALHAGITEDNPKQLNKALQAVAGLSKHDDLVVLIGDGSSIDEQTVQTITDLSAHNDIIAVLVSDPVERRIDANGNLLFTDAHAWLDVDTSAQRFASGYRGLFAQRKTALAAASARRAIPIIDISTDQEVLDQLRRQLGEATRSQQAHAARP